MDGTDPPGELIHSATSAAESSAARVSSCVASSVPLSSSSTPSSTKIRLEQQLFPDVLAEGRVLVFVSHGAIQPARQPRSLAAVGNFATAAAPAGKAHGRSIRKVGMADFYGIEPGTISGFADARRDLHERGEPAGTHRAAHGRVHGQAARDVRR